MKLIIDIPEEIYKASKIIDVQYEDVVQIPLEVIANGTPLDKIRNEIELKEKTLTDKYGQQKYGVWTDDALQIIDKYREEQTDAT